MADTKFRAAADETAPTANLPTAAPRICVIGSGLGKDAQDALVGRLSANVLEPSAIGTPSGTAALVDADVIVLALGGADPARTLLSAIANDLHGKTVLWISGGTSDDIIGAKSEAENRPSAFVDAAFCNVPTIKADSVLAWSGDQTSGALLEPLFAAISRKNVFCGATGLSADLATLNAAITSICAVVTVECAMVGERFGLKMERMGAVLGIGSGGSAALRSILPRLVAKGDRTPVLAQVTLELKRFNQLALDAGAPVFIAQAARAVIEATLIHRGAKAGFDDLASYFVGAR